MKRIGLCMMACCLAMSGAAQTEGYLINPSGIVLGETGVFKMDLQPASFPDDQISWIDNSGRVSFLNGNKGRMVTVKGETLGDFKLTVKIGSMADNWYPYFFGRVVDSTETALHFFVICDANDTPAVLEAQIDLWVAEANRIFRQVGMSFTKASVTTIKNANWFQIESRSDLLNMFSHTNNVGGLEVYCINKFVGDYTGTLGAAIPGNPSNVVQGTACGIAVAANARPFTLAHEIGHACRLDDIVNGPLQDLVREELVGADNWSGGSGTGYYPHGQKHMDLIKILLMYQYQKDDECVDIPLGNVMGYDPDDDTFPYVIKSRSVGLKSMNRQPKN